MAAVFNWAQTVGAPAGTRQDLGQSGNLFNFKNIDSLGTSQYDTFPIRQGNNSFEVWLQARWTGIFTAIYDPRFWMSTNFSPSTGLTVKCNSQRLTSGYLAPTSLTSSIATANISTSDPGTQNVSLAGSLGTSLTTSGYSDYIVMQLQTTVSAPPGDTSLAVFTLSYLEV